MRLHLTLSTTFLYYTLLSAFPTPSPHTSNAIAYVRLVSSVSHYSHGSNHQSSSSDPPDTFPVLVGSKLEFNFWPPYAMGFQIAHVTQGESADGDFVREDEMRVVCAAAWDGIAHEDGEDLTEGSIRVGETRVLRAGRMVRVAWLQCQIEK